MKKSQKKNIDSHLEATRYWGPSDNTILSVNFLNKYQRRVLDLGCGSLRNSKFLFNSGFVVDAVDKDPDVKNYTEFFKNRPKGLFNLKITDYLKLDLEVKKYDIVVAQNSLSFNTKTEVRKMINKIYRALKTGGFFAGNLYGLKDFRVEKGNMSFYTEDGVISSMSKFKIEKMNEAEGNTEENGRSTHWHTFEFVAKKK